MEDTAKTVTTAKPKNGKRWEHKELEARIKEPSLTRVWEQGGLYGVVRRGKDGAPSVMFRWRFRHDNKLADFTAGTWPGDSLKEIREEHERAVALHSAGKNPTTERNLQKLAAAHAQTEQLRVHEEETVKALALRWQALELVKRGDKGRKDNGAEVIRSFERDVFPSIGSTPINSVPRSAWTNLFDEVKVRAPRMAARLFADLTQFLEWCERRDYIEVSPLHKIRKSDIASPYKERQRFLWNPDGGTPETELLELREKLPAAKLQRSTELALWLMLSTGCRVGEVSMAAWKNVNFEKREWVFPADDTKNGMEHRVYLSDFTLRHLEELHKLTGKKPWCFPAKHNDGHVCEKSISKQIHDRQRSEPMKNRTMATDTLLLSGGPWTPHDLRRTSARILGGVGTDPMTIEACINHVMEKLKRTYQKSVPWESKREAWDKLGKYLDSIFTEKDQEIASL
ncbi:MAG: site-specific integrase [Burkholderiaceae bacterium]|nr:site-specific integrase [Burkholderiaceae bacterium]